jgi:hypothetical protein
MMSQEFGTQKLNYSVCLVCSVKEASQTERQDGLDVLIETNLCLCFFDLTRKTIIGFPITHNR